MRVQWLQRPHTLTLGASRVIGYRPFNFHGPVRMIGSKLIGFMVDDYYDGTAYELHLWNWVLYYDVKYTPEA